MNGSLFEGNIKLKAFVIRRHARDAGYSMASVDAGKCDFRAMTSSVTYCYKHNITYTCIASHCAQESCLIASVS